jgi:signal transduction histidine kinase
MSAEVVPDSDPPPTRVLVVDDEAALMLSLCDTLRDQGYEPTGFLNGKDALRALHQGRYDVMLADLAMPGMDGISLLRDALAIDDLLVGIIMTGEGTIGTAVEAMRSGAYDYILKPFRLSTVLPVLQRGLAMRTLRLRNAELERRLRERADELEIANSELDAFTRSASHDLRSPLAAIVGLCSLLEHDFGSRLPQRAADWLAQIETQGRRAATLLDDLMRLSRMGRQALELQPIDPAAVARDVMRELLEEEPDRRIEFKIDAMPEATADPNLLRQVYVNLLSNAVKFTRGRDPARIEVGATTDAAGVVYHVRDDGAGFDMARAGKLFEAFHRLHRDDEFEGSGVGLSIVQRIVHRHGGRIWAEGAPGRGACFRFTLGGKDRVASVLENPQRTYQ